MRRGAIGLSLAMLVLSGCARAPAENPATLFPIAWTDSRNCGAPGSCIDLAVAVDLSVTAFRAIDRPSETPPGACDHFPRCRPAPGSVAAAEFEAIRALLGALDSDRVAITVITFSWLRESSSRAGVVAALTNDYPAVDTSLSLAEERGFYGYERWMSQGIDESREELTGLRGAHATPAENARKIALVMMAGPPEDLHFPLGQTVAALERAKRAAISVHFVSVASPGAMAGADVREAVKQTGGTVSEAADGGALTTQLVSIGQSLSKGQ